MLVVTPTAPTQAPAERLEPAGRQVQADLILGQTKVDGTWFYDLPIASPSSLRSALEDLGDDLLDFVDYLVEWAGDVAQDVRQLDGDAERLCGRTGAFGRAEHLQHATPVTMDEPGERFGGPKALRWVRQFYLLIIPVTIGLMMLHQGGGELQTVTGVQLLVEVRRRRAELRAGQRGDLLRLLDAPERHIAECLFPAVLVEPPPALAIGALAVARAALGRVADTDIFACTLRSKACDGCSRRRWR